MSIKARSDWNTLHNASKMLAALANAAKNEAGVMASDMPVKSGMARQAAARLLRQRGIAVYARRAAEHSIWFLLHRTDEPVMLREWRDRVLADCYSEVCRTHMALKPHQWASKEASELATFAVVVGGWLGKDVDTVLVDIQPDEAGPLFQPVLDDLDAHLDAKTE